MPKHGPNIWVTGRGGRYFVKKEGVKRSVIRVNTQGDAVKIGRLLAKENKSELIIQARDGRIRQKDSHGYDSFPPRG